MYTVGDLVQIYNHSEPSCNGRYGTVVRVTRAYDKSFYYDVQLTDMDMVCSCAHDELMEG